MSYKVQQITEPLLLGEGPHWDERQQALFFINILGKTIHKYVLASRKHTKTTLDGRPGFIVPVEGSTDQFVVGLERRFVIIQWDGQDGSKVKVVRELGEVDQHEPINRINDGKADPRGRLFAGTMSGGENVYDQKKKCALYRVEADRGVHIEAVAHGITVANGLAWDLNEKAFYYNDSFERAIRRYDYDVETGNISNKTIAFDLAKNNLPENQAADGMTIDTDGNLWVAVFNSSSVIKVDPRTGKVLQAVTVPAKQVTSATFGGPNYDVLFVTSAGMNIGEEQVPPCGATFMVTGLGVKGTPNVNFKLKP